MTITDVRGGLPTIAYIMLDGAEVLRAFFPGAPNHTVVFEGIHVEHSVICPLVFRALFRM